MLAQNVATSRQPMLPLPRRRFTNVGKPPRPYRLPNAVRDRLASSLAGFRNGERAMALALFLSRYWSMPSRVALPFPIDRRALADREDLALSEAEVRGAIKTLEAVGFLARWETRGSAYKATPDGLRRKPVPFTFGEEFMPMFIRANGRAAAARGGQEGARRCQTPAAKRGPSVSVLAGRGIVGQISPKLQCHNSPKDKSEAQAALLMGEIVSARAVEPNANLEAALARLLQGIRQSRG